MNSREKKWNFNIKTFVSFFYQFSKFGIVGIFNTLVSLIVYYIFIYINFNYIVANTMGFIVGVLNAYVWNSRYVFKNGENRDVIKSLTKVYASYGLTFALNTGLLFFMVNYLNISSYISPIINVFLIFPINFLLNKYWAFK